MARKRSFLDQLQRDAYFVSRTAGDASALQKGGVPRLAKKVLRRQVVGALFRGLGR